MGREIERKFLVRGRAWRTRSPVLIRQGYLQLDPERTVRVRIAGRRGFLTVKGLTRGATRDEFEYPVPVEDARDMLDRLCLRPLLEKKRHVVRFRGRRWEVDEFLGANRGLVVAEVELPSERASVDLPPWAGREVTRDPRYYNANLIRRPYRTWKATSSRSGGA